MDTLELSLSRLNGKDSLTRRMEAFETIISLICSNPDIRLAIDQSSLSTRRSGRSWQSIILDLANFITIGPKVETKRSELLAKLCKNLIPCLSTNSLRLFDAVDTLNSLVHRHADSESSRVLYLELVSFIYNSPDVLSFPGGFSSSSFASHFDSLIITTFHAVSSDSPSVSSLLKALNRSASSPAITITESIAKNYTFLLQSRSSVETEVLRSLETFMSTLFKIQPHLILTHPGVFIFDFVLSLINSCTSPSSLKFLFTICSVFVDVAHTGTIKSRDLIDRYVVLRSTTLAKLGSFSDPLLLSLTCYNLLLLHYYSVPKPVKRKRLSSQSSYSLTQNLDSGVTEFSKILVENLELSSNSTDKKRDLLKVAVLFHTKLDSVNFNHELFRILINDLSQSSFLCNDVISLLSSIISCVDLQSNSLKFSDLEDEILKFCSSIVSLGFLGCNSSVIDLLTNFLTKFSQSNRALISLFNLISNELKSSSISSTIAESISKSLLLILEKFRIPNSKEYENITYNYLNAIFSLNFSEIQFNSLKTIASAVSALIVRKTQRKDFILFDYTTLEKFNINRDQVVNHVTVISGRSSLSLNFQVKFFSFLTQIHREIHHSSSVLVPFILIGISRIFQDFLNLNTVKYFETILSILEFLTVDFVLDTSCSSDVLGNFCQSSQILIENLTVYVKENHLSPVLLVKLISNILLWSRNIEDYDIFRSFLFNQMESIIFDSLNVQDVSTCFIYLSSENLNLSVVFPLKLFEIFNNFCIKFKQMLPVSSILSCLFLLLSSIISGIQILSNDLKQFPTNLNCDNLIVLIKNHLFNSTDHLSILKFNTACFNFLINCKDHQLCSVLAEKGVLSSLFKGFEVFSSGIQRTATFCLADTIKLGLIVISEYIPQLVNRISTVLLRIPFKLFMSNFEFGFEESDEPLTIFLKNSDLIFVPNSLDITSFILSTFKNSSKMSLILVVIFHLINTEVIKSHQLIEIFENFADVSLAEALVSNVFGVCKIWLENFDACDLQSVISLLNCSEFVVNLFKCVIGSLLLALDQKSNLIDLFESSHSDNIPTPLVPDLISFCVINQLLNNSNSFKNFGVNFPNSGDLISGTNCASIASIICNLFHMNISLSVNTLIGALKISKFPSVSQISDLAIGHLIHIFAKLSTTLIEFRSFSETFCTNFLNYILNTLNFLLDSPNNYQSNFLFCDSLLNLIDCSIKFSKSINNNELVDSFLSMISTHLLATPVNAVFQQFENFCVKFACILAGTANDTFLSRVAKSVAQQFFLPSHVPRSEALSLVPPSFLSTVSSHLPLASFHPALSLCFFLQELTSNCFQYSSSFVGICTFAFECIDHVLSNFGALIPEQAADTLHRISVLREFRNFSLPDNLVHSLSNLVLKITTKFSQTDIIVNSFNVVTAHFSALPNDEVSSTSKAEFIFKSLFSNILVSCHSPIPNDSITALTVVSLLSTSVPSFYQGHLSALLNDSGIVSALTKRNALTISQPTISSSPNPLLHSNHSSWVCCVLKYLVDHVSKTFNWFGNFQAALCLNYRTLFVSIPLLVAFDPTLPPVFFSLLTTSVIRQVESLSGEVVPLLLQRSVSAMLIWIPSFVSLLKYFGESVSISEWIDLKRLAVCAFKCNLYHETVYYAEQILQSNIVDPVVRTELLDVYRSSVEKLGDIDAYQGFPPQQDTSLLFGKYALNSALHSNDEYRSLAVVNASLSADPSINRSCLVDLGLEQCCSSTQGFVTSSKFELALKLGDWKQLDTLEFSKPTASFIHKQPSVVAIVQALDSIITKDFTIQELVHRDLVSAGLSVLDDCGPYNYDLVSLERVEQLLAVSMLFNQGKASGFLSEYTKSKSNQARHPGLFSDVLKSITLETRLYAQECVELFLEQSKVLREDKQLSKSINSLATVSLLLNSNSHADWCSLYQARAQYEEISLLRDLGDSSAALIMASQYVDKLSPKTIEESICKSQLLLLKGSLEAVQHPNSFFSNLSKSSSNLESSFNTALSILTPLTQEHIVSLADTTPTQELSKAYHLLAEQAHSLYRSKLEWVKQYSSSGVLQEGEEFFKTFANSVLIDIASLRESTFDYYSKAVIHSIETSTSTQIMVTLLSLLLETMEHVRNNDLIDGSTVRVTVDSSRQETVCKALFKIPDAHWAKFSLMLVTNISANSKHRVLNFPREIVQRLLNSHPHHVYLFLKRNASDSSNSRECQIILDSFSRSSSGSSVANDYDQMLGLYMQLGTFIEQAKMMKGPTMHNSKMVNLLSKFKAPSRIPVFTAIKPFSSQSSLPLFASFVPHVQILSGVNVPVKLTAIDHRGTHHFQLLKHGTDDLRDAAGSKFTIEVMNSLLAADKKCKTRNLNFKTYEIIPMTVTLGIIEFLPNVVAFGSYLRQAHPKYRPGDLSVNDVRSHLAKSHEAYKDNPKRLLNDFERICSRFLPVFRYFFIENYHTATEWYLRRQHYTRSAAVTSIICYVLGIGDRHSENLMIDHKTAEIVHIDLEYLFDSSKRLKVPEVVPFRLTRDVRDPFGSSGVDGTFRNCAEACLSLFRSHSLLLTSLASIVLLSSDSQFKRLTRSVRENVAAVHKAVQELMAKLTGTQRGVQLSVSSHVQQLIDEATSSANLCRMFPGWNAAM
ncbi:hypothetical protein RCL1_000587 [Eukaryota sp. TZLM3-RCL]